MKGMQKISRGKGFEGVLKYAFERDTPFAQPGCLIGGNMTGATVAQLIREFGQVHALRSDIEKPVWHNSLRLPEGDKLSPMQWDTITADYIEKMGFSKLNPYCVVLHDDAEGQHVHIIASRIALDRSVYLGRNENLISTRIISELEKKHDLTLTKGLEYDENNNIVTKVAKARVKRGELERAKRTGEIPVRLRLQVMLDLAIKGKPTIVVFMERLESHGVSVIPNLASTGKLNGFSFELDGIAFKGSQLGAAYSWSKLQKSGVSYESSRDYDELSSRRNQANQEVGAEREREPEAIAGVSRYIEPVTIADNSIDTGVCEINSSGIVRDDTNDETISNRVEGLARSISEPINCTDNPNAIGISGDVTGSTVGNQRSDRIHDNSISSEHGQCLDRNARNGAELEYADRYESEQTIGCGKDEGAPTIGNPNREAGDKHKAVERIESARASREKTDQVVADNNSNSSGIEHDNGGSDWNLLFRRASTESKLDEASKDGNRYDAGAYLEQSDPKRKRIDVQDINQVSPVHFLESRGFTVKKSGNGYSVTLDAQEAYRLYYTPEGWLWCDRYGNVGGDSVDLVKAVDGMQVSYIDAVYALGGGSSSILPPKVEDKKVDFVPSHRNEDIDAGRNYLVRERGININTIKRAESQGFLAYAYNAVCFVGRSIDDAIRSVTKLLISVADGKPNKRDVNGSTKAFSPVLFGQEGGGIWIVSEAIDALAVQEMYERKGRLIPTVIVSGGLGAIAFIDIPHTQELLKSENLVVVALDNEKNANNQDKTNIVHQAQINRLKEIGIDVKAWSLPEGVKDLVEFNQQQKKDQERNLSRFHGMSRLPEFDIRN